MFYPGPDDSEKEKPFRFSLTKKHLLKIVTVMFFPKRYITPQIRNA